MNLKRRGILIAFAVVTFRASILAYGPLGHEIVGAIADERLANTPTAAKVYALLDGLRLEKAALIADEIKGWDKKGVDDSRSFHYSAHVGANYFDAQANPTDPEKNKSALADEGGNTFTLELSDEPPRGRGIRKKKFHGFWDYDAVNALFPKVPGRLPKRNSKRKLTLSSSN